MLLQALTTLALLAAPADTAVLRDIEVAPGETLRTTSVGAGEPLVLIPGLFGAAFGFRAIIPALVAQGYRCIVVEPLGYGWSSRPKRADYSFSAQTDRVGKALDSLVGAVTHAAEVPHEERELLRDRLVDFSADSVSGSGQYIQEEQPEAVVAAVARLREAAGN